LGDPVLVTNALISSISSGSQNFVQRLDSYGDDTRIFPLPIHALSDGGVLVSDLKSISTNYESNNNNSSNRNEQEDSKKLSLASLNVAGLRTQFQQRSSFLKPDWVENYCLKDDLSINRAVWGLSNIKKKNIDFIFMYFYSNVIKYFDVYSM
jgi:hypothetical protein